MADQFIADPRGKISIIGVWEEIAALNFPAVHPLLFVVTAWRGAVGTSFLAETRIWTPSQTLLFTTGAHPVQLSPMGKGIAVDQAIGLQFPAPGIYRLELMADGQSVHTADFSLSQPVSTGAQFSA